MFASKYVQCEKGYEASATFDGQTTADGHGACLFSCDKAAPPCTVSGGHGTCTSSMANATTRFCVGAKKECGVLHFKDGPAKDCSEQLKVDAPDYIRCDKGYEAAAVFSPGDTAEEHFDIAEAAPKAPPSPAPKPATKAPTKAPAPATKAPTKAPPAPGRGKCLFTCKKIVPQCVVSGGHGTCTAGLASPTSRFCIGGDHMCGVFHHKSGAAKDCTAEVQQDAKTYVKCDKGYAADAKFDSQATADGQGACLFQCLQAAKCDAGFAPCADAPTLCCQNSHSSDKSHAVLAIILGSVGFVVLLGIGAFGFNSIKKQLSRVEGGVLPLSEAEMGAVVHSPSGTTMSSGTSAPPALQHEDLSRNLLDNEN